MPIIRHFLSWDRPLTEVVADFLLGLAVGRPADLSSLLVLVPTRQAGRRLKETLVSRLAETGRGLLPPRLETPTFLVRPDAGSGRQAGSVVELAVWVEVLRESDATRLQGLFPVVPVEVDFSWAMTSARTILSLRSTLAEAGLLLADVARRPGLPESDRWRDLAFLEERYTEKLAAAGFVDRSRVMRQAAADCAMPAGITGLVVAGVADPMPLAVTAIECLARKYPVTMLIHAPAELADHFDAVGRPMPDWWGKVDISIADPEQDIISVSDPAAQAATVLAMIADPASQAQTAVGVPDPTVVPELLATLARHGLPAYDPAGLMVREHGVYRLFESFVGLLTDDSYQTAAAFIRQADLLRWLAQDTGCDSARLLAELDALQNRYLPASFAAIHRLLLAMAEENKARRYPNLAVAVERIHQLVTASAALSPPEAARHVWTQVYGARLVDPSVKPDREFIRVAAKVSQAVEEFHRDQVVWQHFPRTEMYTLFLARLADDRVYPGHDDAAIELLGWLELAWSDAPVLAVTGMNEGRVPDCRLGDPFLPDALAKNLGLRDADTIYARDSYLLASLIKSRRAAGRVCLISGRLSAQGDPLKPSRLLLACRDEELATRAARLFGARAAKQDNPPARVSFPYRPFDLASAATHIDRLPVTGLREYLACPFRFYLKRVLGMERVDDEKRELDAMDFGDLAHTVLEEMGRDEAAWNSDDPGRIARFLHDRLDQLVRGRYGASPPLTVLLQVESLKQRLAAAARQQAELVGAGWRVHRVEHTFSLDVAGIAITGRIDRIDQHPLSGRLRLYDYKTSDSPATPEKIHLGAHAEDTSEYRVVDYGGKARRWSDLQLPVYLMALQQAEGVQVACEAAYWNLPKAVGEGGVVVWDGCGPELVASARRCLDGVVADLIARRFWPPSARVHYDDFAELFTGPAEQCFCGPASASPPGNGQGISCSGDGAVRSASGHGRESGE